MSAASSPTADANRLSAQGAAMASALLRLSTEVGVPIDLPSSKATEGERPTVVVVGEPKGGKSTLVNALVEHADLSPTDYAVATATYIAISYGPPGARVWPEGATGPVAIALEELPAWTSVEGLEHNPRAPKVPQPVEVTLIAALLEHINIIDSPGVGGFDPLHDRAALDALSNAAALLFCVDSSRPISEPELAFLREATTRISHVTFVLTKADQHASTDDVLRDCQSKVAEFAPDFANAPWFPVAATLAEQALRPNLSKALATELHNESGVGALTTHLVNSVAARAQLIVAQNAIRALQPPARHLLAAIEERIADMSAPTDDVDRRLADAEVELRSLASREDDWRTSVQIEMSELGRIEGNNLDVLIRNTRAAGIDAALDLHIPPDVLVSIVNAPITAFANEAALRIENDILGKVKAVLGSEVIASPFFSSALSEAARAPDVLSLRSPRVLVAEGRLQPSQTMPLITAGTGALVLTGQVAILAAFPPLLIAAAVSSATYMFARRQSRVSERRNWVEARSAEAEIDVRTVIDHHVQSATLLVQNALRNYLRGRKSELEARIVENDDQKKRNDAERAKAQQVLTKAKADVVRVIRDVESSAAQATA